MRLHSLVEIQNQILGVAMPIIGTPFSLHYRSDRVLGRAGAYKLTIPVSGTRVPVGLKGIVLEIHTAGRCFTEQLLPAPNQHYTFTWDGRDADGHAVQGKQSATIRLGYVYRGLYPRPEHTQWQERTAPLGAWDARIMGLGGWNLNVHHAYDHVGQVLYFGNGRRRKLATSETTAKVVGANESIDAAQGDEPISAQVHEIALPAEDASELYIFGTEGQHVRTLDALTGALLWRFAYDDAGRLAVVEDGNGNITHIEHLADGAPSAIVAPYGQRTVLNLNTDGFLVGITNPGDQAAQFSYTSTGLLTSHTDPLGNISHYTYDEDGRLIKEEKPGGGFAALARTRIDHGSKVVRLTAMGRESSYTIEHLPTGEERRINRCCGSGQIVALTATDGTRTITYPNGTVASRERQSDPRFGTQASLLKKAVFKTPSGLVTTTAFRRSTLQRDSDDPMSLAVQTDMVSVNDRVYTRVYTAASRTLISTTPGGRQVTAILDSCGRIAQAQTGSLLPINYCYDTRGRLTTALVGTRPDMRAIHFSYNNDGYLESITDPLERTVRFVYDMAGRVVQQILPDGREIGYAYDTSGNVTALTPPGRPAHTFTYTPDDLPSTYSPPIVDTKLNETRYTYDADQHLNSIIRPDNQVVELGYDSTGRLSTLAMPHGQVSYAYDIITGMLRTITAPGENILTFDRDGALLTTETWTGAIAGSVSRSYDNNFWVTSQSVNGGPPITYQYDDDGLLVRAGDLTLHRDMRTGLIIGTTLRNVTTTRSYNDFGELSRESAAFKGIPFYTVEYRRDRLGRIMETIETIEGETDTYRYSYAPAGHLVQVHKNDAPVASYTYDSNGNRLSYSGPSGSIAGSYDDQDRLTQYGTTCYTYTANGELLNKSMASQTTTYQFDVLGNLIAVTLPDGTQIEYLVDGRNRRIGKKVNSTLVQIFLYEVRPNPSAQLDPTNERNEINSFVYASRNNVPDYMVKGDGTYRIITNHLGSPRLVIDVVVGAVVQRMDYDEFGNITKDTNPDFQPFGFAGGLYDCDTRLLHFGTRDYDAEIGRWTTKDLIGFAGGDMNLYRYVWNEPLNYIDPYGLWGIGPQVTGVAEEGGLSSFPMGVNASFGLGIFGGGSQGINFGDFVSFGGILDTQNYPSGQNAVTGNGVLGMAAGIGSGIFITNADCPKELGGPFDTWSLNTPIGSIQFEKSGGTWLASWSPSSVSWSPSSGGFSVSAYPTTTLPQGVSNFVRHLLGI